MRILLNLAVAVLLTACTGQSALAQTSGAGTVGNPAATVATQIGGRDASGGLRVPRVNANGELSIICVSGCSGGGGGGGATLDSNGDLRVPTVTVTAFYVSLSANTSTELLAASSTRIAVEIQCDGTAAIGLSNVHATLTKAVPDGSGSGGVDVVMPQGTTPMYIPLYVSAAGITAYSTSAQRCWGKSYARQ